MFDYFEIDASILPLVPPELEVNTNGRAMFQTKDTDAQASCTYIQDRDKILVLEQTSGEWVPGQPADENSSIGEKLAALGSYVVTDTSYVDHMISGVVRFYTNLQHVNCDGTTRYVGGWIEYAATYDKGYLKSIEVSEHNPPYQLTKNQALRLEKSREKTREESYQKLIERRMTNPSNVERLVDNIDELATNRKPLYDENDLTQTLNKIKQLIGEYREKHDIFYRTPERKAL